MSGGSGIDRKLQVLTMQEIDDAGIDPVAVPGRATAPSMEFKAAGHRNATGSKVVSSDGLGKISWTIGDASDISIGGLHYNVGAR